MHIFQNQYNRFFREPLVNKGRKLPTHIRNLLKNQGPKGVNNRAHIPSGALTAPPYGADLISLLPRAAPTSEAEDLGTRSWKLVAIHISGLDMEINRFRSITK